MHHVAAVVVDVHVRSGIGQIRMQHVTQRNRRMFRIRDWRVRSSCGHRSRRARTMRIGGNGGKSVARARGDAGDGETGVVAGPTLGEAGRGTGGGAGASCGIEGATAAALGNGAGSWTGKSGNGIDVPRAKGAEDGNPHERG